MVKSYTDRGVSAFRGANKRHGELANILKAIEVGIIKPGEHLIIESVDRLSRQAPMEALDTLKQILKRGIIVHTVMDRRFYTYNSVNGDLTQLLVLLISMARANEESKVKGSRVADAWVRSRNGNDIVSGKVPGWLRVVPKSELTDPIEVEHARQFGGDRGFTVNPHRLKLLRWMFDQVASGVSCHAVARMLNAQNEEPWGNPRKSSTGKHRWIAASVVSIITTKTCLGEYVSNVTSYDETGKRSLTVAKVKPNYYPPVIEPDVWRRAQATVAGRKLNFIRGNTGETFTNLFKDVTECAHCGGRMVLRTSGKSEKALSKYKGIYKFFRCRTRGDNACENPTTFRYQPFEDSFLEWVQEIDLVDNRSTEVADLERRIAEKTIRIEALEAECRQIIAEFKRSRTGARMVDEKEAEIDKLDAVLKEDRNSLALAQAAQSPQDRIAALANLIAKMGTADSQELFQIRAALNQKIREVVSKIVFYKNGFTDVTVLNDPHTRYRFYRGLFAGFRRAKNKFPEFDHDPDEFGTPAI